MTDGANQDKWSWWQGYIKDRTMLGFGAPAGKNVTLHTKKAPKRRKREDD